LGLDGERSLSTSDPVVRLSNAVLAGRIEKFRASERRALAVEIVNALGEAMKKGR
jgi:hypothetical protein